jgi:hypothetical protein
MRQVGGALGVAVLGSILSQVYRGQISDQLAGLPARLRDTAAESIASTYSVAAKAGAAGDALIAPANHAFVYAMHWVAAGSALTALIGVAAVLRWLPRQAAHQPIQPPAVEPAVESGLVEVS